MSKDPNPQNEDDAALGQLEDYARANHFDSITPGEGYGCGTWTFDQSNYYDSEMYAWL